MELKNLTIKEAHQGIIKREFSVWELTKSYLDKIKREDGKINSFLTVVEDSALERAKEIDEKFLAEKGRGKEIPFLAGIPVAVKDNILVKDLKSTAGSKILQNYIAPYDATVIKKLKNQGAIILGKTNMDEFGMGSSTENSAFGPTRNPYDLTRVPGGTSGGSAAAVASDMCVAALGSDTGGSIRQPAGFCGVVGLRPTYGAVSRYGLIAFASSLDQIGPITKTVGDAKIVFEAMRDRDEMDSTSLELNPKSDPVRNFVSNGVKTRNPKFTPLDSSASNGARIQNSKFKIQNLKIGVPKEYFTEAMDPEVEEIIKKAIKECEGLGVRVEEISLPHTKYALACYYIICTSEASANLARYDGIRYGFKNVKPVRDPKSSHQSLFHNFLTDADAKCLSDVYLEDRGEGFGIEVKRRIMLGVYALSAGYYEAYYLKAQKVRGLIKQDFDRAFEKCDLIFAPTSPTIPFKFGEKTKDPLQMYLSDILTVPVSLAGIPALSLPIGKAKGLPVGLQIIGKPFQEMEILEFGNYVEKNICSPH